MKKVAVIGLGSFGSNVVKILANKKGIDIIAIDSDENKVNQIKDLATQPISMDATNKDNLVACGIEDVDFAVVSSGPSLEPSILTVHILKEIGVPKIIAKALTEDHEIILRLVGAHEVVFPERDEAQKLGHQIMAPNLIDYLKLQSGFEIQEMAAPDAFIGKSLQELEMRRKYKITVLAIKSIIPDVTTLNPPADMLIKDSDLLILFGESEDIDNLHKKLKHT